MSFMADVTQWSSAIAGALGHDIGWDGTGECVLSFTDDIDILVARVPDTGDVSLRARLDAGTQPSLQHLQAALALNYGCLPPGFALASATSGELALVSILPGDNASLALAQWVLDGFVTLIPQIRERLLA